jgi:hypothetical protein
MMMRRRRGRAGGLSAGTGREEESAEVKYGFEIGFKEAMGWR